MESDLDAYSPAYQVASLLNQLFGKGKEPFRPQAYTRPVKFVSLLRRFADRYIRLQGVYRVALEEVWLAEQVQAVREVLDFVPGVRATAMGYTSHAPVPATREVRMDARAGVMGVRADTELAAQIKEARCRIRAARSRTARRRAAAAPSGDYATRPLPEPAACGSAGFGC